MPSFDVQAARTAGYGDDEILSHLTESRKFDIDGAVKAGYSKSEIIDHLASTAPAAPTPAQGQPARKEGDLGPSPAVAEFGNTIFHDLASLPAGIVAFVRHPIDTTKAMVGKMDFEHPENSSGILGLPDTIAKEWESGHKGAALAHLAEVVGPGAVHAAPTVADAASAVPARAAAAASGTLGKVVDIATNPATKDIAGVISPRLSHALNLATRLKKAFDTFREAEAPAAEVPAATAPQAAAAPTLTPPAGPREVFPAKPTDPTAGKVLPPQPARSLAQTEAAMAQKAPGPVEAPQSGYTEAGDLKSPQLRAQELINANRVAKAQRFAAALHEQGIEPAEVMKIPMGTFADSQIAKGASPGWGNIAELLGEKAPSADTINAIHAEMQRLQKASSAVSKKPGAAEIAAQLKAAMEQSGTISPPGQ